MVDWNDRIWIDWEDIEGKTIKEIESNFDNYDCDVKITFTDGFEVIIEGGSSSGNDLLQIYTWEI